MGGGVQVADSLCCMLSNYKQHQFIVVLSSWMEATQEKISNYDNVTTHIYSIKKSVKTLMLGRDAFLDKLVDNHEINVVLTVFGPSWWIPRVTHLSGFARPHLVQKESPYFNNISFSERLKLLFIKWSFNRCSKNYWTENPLISESLKTLFPNKEVFTITNYYNQVFDKPNCWKQKKLPKFSGNTFLTVSAPHANKNLKIALDVARILRKKNPSFVFRFVFTIDEADYPQVPNELKGNFLFVGRVTIEECPSLYQQADIMFQPSLLECFSASYPEAMKMSVPIVTTDLAFAKGLCGDAAVYYSAIDAADAANKLYEVSHNEQLKCGLIAKGVERLKKFDDYNKRADKLISLCEQIASK